MKLMSILAFCLMAVISLPAMAAETLSWEAPTTRVDGSTLEASEIDSYEICVNTPDTEDCTISRSVDATETMYSLEQLVSDYQEYSFQIRVMDTEGRVSEWSDAVTGRLFPDPSAPVLQFLPNG